MTTSLTQATAAPIEINLGGKVRRLRPLTDADYGEFEAWIKTTHIKLARDNLENVPEDMRQDFLAAALAQASTMHVGTQAVASKMTSIPGAIKLLYLCLRHDDDKITEEAVAKWMTTEEEIDAALEALELLEAINVKPPTKKKRLTKKTAKRIKKKKVRRKATRRNRK